MQTSIKLEVTNYNELALVLGDSFKSVLVFHGNTCKTLVTRFHSLAKNGARGFMKSPSLRFGFRCSVVN